MFELRSENRGGEGNLGRKSSNYSWIVPHSLRCMYCINNGQIWNSERGGQVDMCSIRSQLARKKISFMKDTNTRIISFDIERFTSWHCTYLHQCKWRTAAEIEQGDGTFTYCNQKRILITHQKFSNLRSQFLQRLQVWSVNILETMGENLVLCQTSP